MRRRYSPMVQFCMACAILTLSLCPQILFGQDSTKTWLAKAEKYGKEGYFGLAAKAYSRAIAIDPRNIQAFFLRGRVFHLLDLEDRALADLNSAIKLDSTFASGYHWRGIVYEKKGKINKAIADFSRAISIDDGKGDSYFSRGYCYKQKGNYEKAINDFSKVIALAPNIYLSYFYRGHSYHRQKKYTRAIEDYLQVLKLKPENMSALNNIADCYLKAGQPEPGLHYLATALKLEPSRPVLYMTLGELFEFQKRFSDALTAFQHCRDLAAGDKNEELVKMAEKKIVLMKKQVEKN